MKKNDYLNSIQREINRRELDLMKLDKKDYVGRGILLGEINGLYIAKLLAFELED